MPDLFDEKASDWDADAMIQKLSSAIGTSILEHITFHNKMDVMDFGAGTGLISSHVATLVNKILAVDISKAMLDNLVSKPEFHGKVEALCQNIIDNPKQAISVLFYIFKCDYYENAKRDKGSMIFIYNFFNVLVFF